MNASVANFTEAECQLVAELLLQRYRQPVLPELADGELQLDAAGTELTSCPALYWSQRGAHFVVCKLGQARYRCQFFYNETDHYGTGHEEYTDLWICVQTMLRVQADHERQRRGVSGGSNAADLAAGTSDDDYHGPLMV